MNKTTVKNFELIGKMEALDALVNGKLSPGLTFQVARLAKVLRAQFEEYATQRDKLIAEGMERNEDGDPIFINEEKTRVMIKDEFLPLIPELDEQEGDDVKQLLASAIVNGVGEIAITTVFALGNLVYDDLND